MHPDIHILAACTNRKRLDVPSRLRLRAVARGDAATRAESWWQRLEDDHGDAVAADNLYAGDHWAIVRGLPAVVEQQGLDSESWVISAGYGLVSVKARIRPYSATFSGSHPDSVTNRVTNIVSRK